MKRKIVAALAALLWSCAQEVPLEAEANQPEPGVATAQQALTGPTLARDADAVARLPSSRRTLYTSLASASAKTPELTLDIASGAVMSLGLDWAGPSGDPAADAQTFINSFQPLLDDRVSAVEYVRQPQRAPCDTTVTFDRKAFGLQVAGSRLTFHFVGKRLVFVTNGVAPVKAVKVTVSNPWALPGASDLKKMIGKAPLQGLERVKVMAPMPDGSGMHEADLVAWLDASGRHFGAVAIGDVALTSRFEGSEESMGRTGTGPQAVAGTNTDVPSLQRYRGLGGVQVTSFLAEKNPLESAYRFLEEHSTLLHTGAARCQYVPERLEENPTLPGIYTVKLRQQHGPLRVWGADVVLRLEAVDRVNAVVARARGNIEVEATAVLTPANAITVARAALSGPPPQWAQAVSEALAATPKTELVVFPAFLSRDLQSKRDRLAYEVRLGSFTVIIDAKDGKRLFETSSRHFARIIRDANGGPIVSLAFYRTVTVDGALVPPLLPPVTTDIFPGLDGIAGGLPAALEDYNALLARNGHMSVNGRGGGDFRVNTNVVWETGGCPNAFMDSYVTWNAFFCPGEATADVVGHELTHAIIGATTGVIMSDQSGAINESYADILGDLADRNMNHLIGDTSLSGTSRNLTDPSAFGDPTHFSGFVPRTSACAGAVFPWDCDFGFVHTNSGITNRAHRLMADGATFPLPAGVAAPFPGMGDGKLERLALAVATTQLPSNATMHQVAGATRDLCETFVARGVTELRTAARVPFVASDCEAVEKAFRAVGLDPAMTSGWSEPSLGFFGTDTIAGPGADGIPPLTPGACGVTNFLLEHRVPVLATSLFGDYAANPAIVPALPASTSILGFVATTSFNFAGLPLVTPPGGGFAERFPLNTPVLTRRVNWTSIYGYKPTFITSAQVGTTCAPGGHSAFSNPTTLGFDVGTWTGSATVPVGQVTPTTPLPPTCVLGPPAMQEIELIDGAGNVIAGPGSSVSHTITHWFAFIPVNFNESASIVSRPTSTNLSGVVTTNWDLGRTVRVRWRYQFIAGTGCNPR